MIPRLCIIHDVLVDNRASAAKLWGLVSRGSTVNRPSWSRLGRFDGMILRKLVRQLFRSTLSPAGLPSRATIWEIALVGRPLDVTVISTLSPLRGAYALTPLLPSFECGIG